MIAITKKWMMKMLNYLWNKKFTHWRNLNKRWVTISVAIKGLLRRGYLVKNEWDEIYITESGKEVVHILMLNLPLMYK